MTWREAIEDPEHVAVMQKCLTECSTNPLMVSSPDSGLTLTFLDPAFVLVYTQMRQLGFQGEIGCGLMMALLHWRMRVN